MLPSTGMTDKEKLCTDFYDEVIEAIGSRISQNETSAGTKESASKDTLLGSTSSLEDVVINESLESLFKECRPRELKNMYEIVEDLKNNSAGMSIKIPCTLENYLRFIKTFNARSGWDVSSRERFIMLLSPGDNQDMFEEAVSNLYNALFFMQALPRVTFYELSLVSTLQRTHFKHDRHVGDEASRLCHTYVYTTSREYATNRPYDIAAPQLTEFSRKIESYVNAFNGLVNELHVSQSAIPKILFVLLVLRVEKESIFLKNYGEPELFYCTVRVFHSGAEFAKKLENFMKTQLFWEFRTEKKKYTLDHLFQTIYKHEYRKLVGGVQKINGLSLKYARQRSTISAPHQQRPMMSINILPSVPNIDKSKSIRTFSPLSRKIAEAAGLRDNIASKRKLDFS